MIAGLRGLFRRKPAAPRCRYGCDDPLYINSRGHMYRTTRSILFKRRCPVHSKAGK